MGLRAVSIQFLCYFFRVFVAVPAVRRGCPTGRIATLVGRSPVFPPVLAPSPDARLVDGPATT